jgi:hypothetical protein
VKNQRFCTPHDFMALPLDLGVRAEILPCHSPIHPDRRGLEHHLCRGLCRNPAIPARVALCLRVSLGNRQEAANSDQSRMNTASLCRSHFRRVAPSQFTLRNGMEEVVGSIPTRSTNPQQTRASACGGNTCVTVGVITRRLNSPQPGLLTLRVFGAIRT